MENQTQPSLPQVSEITLSYRLHVKPSQLPKITRSQEAYNLFLNSWDADKIEFIEQFKVMLLNRANKVLGVLEVSSGGVSGTVADPKIIFVAALKANACGIIVAHNHPSGNLKPSESDVAITRKLKEGGKLLEISLLDHVILTTEGHFSFADEGLL
ncbi:MAG: JAB domain-containing protein [Cyclobacteriaceae bacterium]